MIVGNCCANCQRHASNNKNNASSSSSLPKPSSGGAALATSFRRPTARRVRFEATAAAAAAAAPSLPQRIRASAVGLARAAIAAPPTTTSSSTDAHALSAFASQGTSKVVAASSAPSAWSQAAAVRPYWEHENCASSSIYGDGSAAFRSLHGGEMQQRSFDSFAAEREPLGVLTQGTGDKKSWREEFLREAKEFTSSSSADVHGEQLDSTLRTITQSEQWNNGLRTAVKRILPEAERLFDDLKADTKADKHADVAMDDAQTVKRLRMILQHLAYAPSSAAMLSVRRRNMH